ncbi:hypothetical protein CRG98_043226 [Punica granatum]|uniref:Uncharacterized protein n=1 Tax=Punica granatum TaxID=22663 RepID=A0A2I0HXG0_PUNGR|nr:hypothetical protein CRG98_043226 [Punica granatum]
MHPVSYIIKACSFIKRLLHVSNQPSAMSSNANSLCKTSHLDNFLWSARWSPGGPVAIECSAIAGLPLITHLGSILILPDRVNRQLGGLQDIPTEGGRTAYHLTRANTAPSAAERSLRVKEVQRLWGTRIMQRLYYPEHSTDEERAISATLAYVARFHPQGLEPTHQPRATPTSRALLGHSKS